MKTEETPNTAVWSNNVELPNLASEESLPIIGSCQVSSILSNLEDPEKIIQNIDLPEIEVILLQNDYKTNNVVEQNVVNQTNYIILKDNTSSNILNLTTNSANRCFKKTRSKKSELLFMTCDLCPFLSLNESRMTDHIETYHKNGEVPKQIQMSCPACRNVFYHKTPLQNHLLYDHSCPESDVNVIMQLFLANVEEKLREINKEQIVPVESEKVVTKDVVEVPRKLEESPVVNLPTVDLSQNHTEKLFNDYIKRPDGFCKILESKMYHKCPMCKARMMDLEKMNYHVKCHSDGYFKCPECNAAFSFWKPLIGHLWRAHKINMELYSCDKCEYKTFSLAKLNNIHKLIHNEAKSFVCEQCNKAFKNVKQLRNHKTTHKRKTTNTNFNCESCSKKFLDKRQLRVHVDSVHKKLKPFLCNYCGYKASTKSTLRMHIRQHTNEKPFSCDVCDYVTSDHNSLRRHKLRHTGQKPYKCSYCDYGCIQSSTYKIHLKRKHPGMEKDILFSCDQCQFKTINKEIFLTHVATVHKRPADSVHQ